jgi:hypothetical protein
MNRKDYLNLPDVELVNEIAVVHDTALARASDWLIMAAAITDWEPEKSAFEADVELLKDPVNRSPVNTAKKNASKKALLAKFRPFVQGSLSHNSRVTSADLKSMNLPVHKEGRTPHHAPTGRPQLDVRPTNNRQHTIIAESQESGKREKPADAVNVKYCWGFFETKPEEPEELNYSHCSHHLEFVLNFHDHEEGKRVYYAALYENDKGDTGPWSDMVSAIIP